MKKLIVIAGPTASGKTALAIQLAQKYNTEILSADSRQCYKELGVAVAKPSQQELELVKHHFINSHSIFENVTAGDYEKYALQTLDYIFQKNEIAICVGGTGLYIKALCEGIDEMPPIDEAIKKEVEKNYIQNGIDWLQHEVQKNDLVFFSQGEIQNPMRLMRALSFYLSHKKSITSFQSQTTKNRNFSIEKYVIDIDRRILYENINTRVNIMMENYLEDEARKLFIYKDLKSLQTVGYSELFDFFEGKYTLNEAIEKIKQHTRNYAKRQITWFKHQGNFKLINKDYAFF